jgi:hypothetical protein
MSMSPQRVAEIATLCAKLVPNVATSRASEIASIVSRGYFKMIQESEEWKNAIGVCSIDSLDRLTACLLGKDTARILGALAPEEKMQFGFVADKQEEHCFVWTWRAFYLFGRQHHHSQPAPKELVA